MGGVARRGGGRMKRIKTKHRERETETETDRGTQLVLREGCYLEYLAIDGFISSRKILLVLSISTIIYIQIAQRGSKC